MRRRRRIQSGQYAFSHSVWRSQGVFPNPQHPPSAGPEFGRANPVALAIAPDFTLPVLLMAGWHPTVPPAPVPEATINKHDQSRRSKDKVRTAWQRLVPTPPFDAVLAQNSNESDLSCFIASRTDSGHHARALALGEDIRHIDVHGCSGDPRGEQPPRRADPGEPVRGVVLSAAVWLIDRGRGSSNLTL
jgi:hypothetical protein